MPAVMKKKTAEKLQTKKSKNLSPLKNKRKIEKPKKIDILQVKKIKRKHLFDPIRANRGVVYINHIPHGFYEDQLNKYFTQFGEVTRVRVARSQMTGKCKGYAFVEFRHPQVAQIAAETMDNYLMFKKILKTVYIPPENQKYNLFRNNVKFITGPDGERRIESPKTRRIDSEIKKVNIDFSDDKYQKRLDKSMRKLKKQQDKLAAMNVDVNLCDQIVYGLTPDKVNLTKKTLETLKNKSSENDKSWLTIVNEDSVVKKRNSKKNPEKSIASMSKIQKKSDINLAVLMDKTIDSEDSEDEDYIPKEIDEDDEDEDNDNDDENNDDDDDEDEESDNDTTDNEQIQKEKKKQSKLQNSSLSCILGRTLEEENTSADDNYTPESSVNITSSTIESLTELESDSNDEVDDSIINGEDTDNSNTEENEEELPVKKSKKTVVGGIKNQKNPTKTQNDMMKKLLNETIAEDDDSDVDPDFEMKTDSDSVISDENKEFDELPLNIPNKKSNEKANTGNFVRNPRFNTIKKRKNQSIKNKNKSQLKKNALKELLEAKKSPIKKLSVKKNLKKFK